MSALPNTRELDKLLLQKYMTQARTPLEVHYEGRSYEIIGTNVYEYGNDYWEPAAIWRKVATIEPGFPENTDAHYEQWLNIGVIHVSWRI